MLSLFLTPPLFLFFCSASRGLIFPRLLFSRFSFPTFPCLAFSFPRFSFLFLPFESFGSTKSCTVRRFGLHTLMGMCFKVVASAVKSLLGTANVSKSTKNKFRDQESGKGRCGKGLQNENVKGNAKKMEKFLCKKRARKRAHKETRRESENEKTMEENAKENGERES